MPKEKPGSWAGTPGGDGTSFVSANIHSAGCNCQENIPADLRARNQWVAWKSVPDIDGKKPRKVPMDVKTERGAQANNPGTWSSFDDVTAFTDEWAGYDHTHVDGTGAEITGTVSEYPGFMFHPDDPFCGIDLDDCRNPETGDVAPWAREIIEHFNSYTELSQSGTGFHILIKGQKPAGSRSRNGGIECYDRDRYFICTGEVIHDIDTIETKQPELESFLEKTFSAKKKKSAPLNGKRFSPHVDDQKIQDLAKTVLEKTAKRKPEIRAFLNGENPGQPSPSEGDLTTLNKLLPQCRDIPIELVHHVLDHIIRNSKRMRPKWDTVHRPADGATYGQMTIETAMEDFSSGDQDHDELWIFDDAETHIQNQVGRDLSSGQKVELARDVLDHNDFDPLQLNIIMDLLKKVTGITKGAMADLQKKNEDPKPEGDSRTHAELSAAFISERLPSEHKHVVGCEGSLWTYHPESGVYQDSTMKMLAIQVGDHFTGADYCKRSGDYKGISNLIYNRLEDTTFFSTAPRGLPGASAFHQVTSEGEHIIREYSPDLRARFKLPVDPDANCPIPRFDKFLKDTFRDDLDQIELIQEVVGALLCCIAAGLQTAFYFYGPGGNGKNVMLDIVGGLFDDRLKCAIRPDHVVKEYYRAQLAGKLLNIVGEIEKDAFVGSEFKDVVSCDTPVTARLPYQEPFVFIPQCAHLFAGNHLPATKDHSEGQRRRWRFFHFRHRVPEKNRIQYLGRKILKEESPGVLAWALSGAQRLMRNGGVLTPTGAHTDLLEKWKQSSDSVEAFLHDPEIVILGSGMRCYRQKAFDAYIDFCRESNYRGLSKYNFYHRVESIFSVSRKNSEERHFSGFSLVEKEFQF